jgi:hypothetical protein
MKSFLKRYRILSVLLILIGFGIIFGTAGYGCLYWYGARLCKQTKPMPFDQFEIALNDLSTAPFYVLVYVKYPNEKIRPVCVDAWRLLYAIGNEYDINVNKNIEVLLAKILQQKDLTFSFTKQESYFNLTPHDMVDLALVDLLFGKSSEDNALLERFLDKQNYLPHESMAYILIKNGYMVRRGCSSSEFQIYRLNSQLETNRANVEKLIKDKWVPIEPNML